MGLFSSSKTNQTTNNIKDDTALTFGESFTGGVVVAGNDGSPINIQSVDADVVKSVVDFSKVGLSTLSSSIAKGSKDALDAVATGFSNALEASKSSDERLSGKVFTSVNIALGLAALGVGIYIFKK